MKKERLLTAALTMALMSCSRIDTDVYRGVDYSYGKNLSHERIELGSKLDNPFKTSNMRRAYTSLYPTRSGEDLPTTNLYVRILPRNEEEFNKLNSEGLELLDHPLDYEIAKEGDWYHDPGITEGNYTWQYTVVPADFDFRKYHYELLDECFLAENWGSTKASGIDWAEVEKLSYEMTGNADMLSEALPMTKADAQYPSGRITIVDDDANGGKPFGVAGVQVTCNSFVRFASAFTDRDGYYTMSKSFSSDVRYRLVFKNTKGFAIGFNLILVPASVSTLGKTSPEGVNMTITKDSEYKLFNRCVVNNAAYEFFERCSSEDLNLPAPPKDLRFWIFNKLDVSSAVMMHHETVVSQEYISNLLGQWKSLITYFSPDITLGLKGRDNYASIWKAVMHEMSHAAHFGQVGTDYWNKYIWYILESYFTTGFMTYGVGNGSNAGHCEIGEMWAYYMESKMYKDRYGGAFPAFGTDYWFHPQIHRYLDDRGLTPHRQFAALQKDVCSREDLQNRLFALYPEKYSIIEQVFSRYD